MFRTATQWLKGLAPSAQTAAPQHLHQAQQGQHLVLSSIEDAETQQLLDRLGLALGDVVQVLSPCQWGGPVVLRKHWMEVALGEAYARHIRITLLEDGGSHGQ